MFEIKICRIGNKYIVESGDFFLDQSAVHPGVWRIGHDYVYGPLRQQIYTIQGSRICYFDGDFWKQLVKLFQIRHQEIAAYSVTGSDMQLA